MEQKESAAERRKGAGQNTTKNGSESCFCHPLLYGVIPTKEESGYAEKEQLTLLLASSLLRRDDSLVEDDSNGCIMILRRLPGQKVI